MKKKIDRWRWEIYEYEEDNVVGESTKDRKIIRERGAEIQLVCRLTSCRRSEKERENIFWTEAKGGPASLVS